MYKCAYQVGDLQNIFINFLLLLYPFCSRQLAGQIPHPAPRTSVFEPSLCGSKYHCISWPSLQLATCSFEQDLKQVLLCFRYSRKAQRIVSLKGSIPFNQDGNRSLMSMPRDDLEVLALHFLIAHLNNPNCHCLDLAGQSYAMLVGHVCKLHGTCVS